MMITAIINQNNDGSNNGDHNNHDKEKERKNCSILGTGVIDFNIMENEEDGGKEKGGDGHKNTVTPGHNASFRRQNDVTPFTCDVCHKSFATKSNVTRHMSIHKEKSQRRYVCGKCGVRFVRKSSMLTCSPICRRCIRRPTG